MNMYERFKMMAHFKGKTVAECCKDIGIAPSTISSWKTRNNLPTGELSIKIANYFGTSTDFVLGNPEKSSNDSLIKIDEDDYLIIEKYKNSDELTKNMIVRLLAYASDKEGK